MTTLYWVDASGDHKWNNANNWSLTSGGAGGAGVPTSADDVIFDGGGTSNINIDVAYPVCKSLTIQSTYPGNFTYDVESWPHVYGDVTLAGSGTFSLGISHWTIDGNFDFSGQSTFSYGSGEVTMTGTAKTLTYIPSAHLYKLNIAAGATITLTHGGTGNQVVYIDGGLTVNGTLTTSAVYTIVRYYTVTVGPSGEITGNYLAIRSTNYYNDGSKLDNQGTISTDVLYIDYPVNNASLILGTLTGSGDYRIYTDATDVSCVISGINRTGNLVVRTDGTGDNTVRFDATAVTISGNLSVYSNGSGAITIRVDSGGSVAWNKIDIYGSGTGNVVLDCNGIDVGTVICDHGGTVMLASHLTAMTKITIRGAGLNPGIYNVTTAILVADGTGDFNLQTGSHVINSMDVTGSGDYQAGSGNITTSGDVTLAGTYRFHLNTVAWTIGGSFDFSGQATWLRDTGSIIMTGTAKTLTWKNNEKLADLTVAAGADVTLSSSGSEARIEGDLTVNGKATIASLKYCRVYYGSVTIGSSGEIAGNYLELLETNKNNDGSKLTNNGTISVSQLAIDYPQNNAELTLGTITTAIPELYSQLTYTSSCQVHGCDCRSNLKIRNNGPNPFTVTFDGTCNVDAALQLYITDSGPLTINTSANWTIAGNIEMSHPGAGTFTWTATAGGVTLDGAGTQTVDVEGANLRAVVIDSTGTVDIAGDLAADALTRTTGALTTGAITLTVTGTLAINGDGDADVSAATLAGSPAVTVASDSGMTTLPTSSLASLAVTKGDLDISGKTLTVAGDVTVKSPGRLWNGTDADMANAMIDYAGNLDLEGALATPLEITNLDLVNDPGTSSIGKYLTVTNSQHDADGPDLQAYTSNGCVDGGGNTGWDFSADANATYNYWTRAGRPLYFAT